MQRLAETSVAISVVHWCWKHKCLPLCLCLV